MSEIVNIVADIGGTNIRLAIVDDKAHVKTLKLYRGEAFSSLTEVLLTFFEDTQIKGKTINACLAIACPVEQEQIVMTNLPWQFNKTEFKQTLNLNNLWLINDYTAIAHAIPKLTDQQKIQVGQGQVQANKPIAVCGPGTGLGVAHLAHDNGKWICLSGEGGHVDFAPVTAKQIKILEHLMQQYQHVSYEQLLSGLGIEQIYQALNTIEHANLPKLSAAEITHKAIEQECALCQQTLAEFCRILGSFAGNLALTLATFGGVYIAGGIVPRFIDYLQQSEFRRYFAEKGRLAAINEHIATFVITEAQPGILGAAAYLQQQLEQDL